MKRALKSVAVIWAICVALCLAVAFAGCADKYHAKLFDRAEQWIDEGFLKENRVQAFYPNDDFKEGEENSERFIYDGNSPKNRTFVIKDSKTFGEIFAKYTGDVDFGSKLVVLHVFASCYPSREYYLKGVALSKENLTVKYKVEARRFIADAATPAQRCLMLTMDRAEINSAEFIEV